MPRRRRAVALLVPLAVALSSVVASAPPAAAATEPWQQVVTITFPTDPRASFGDTYTACRSGCSRIHQAADLMGPKMWPLFAAVDGRICGINDDAIEASYGRNITVCGNDGNRYRYLHVNNDTPGTDDGKADLRHVYAAGITRGKRVAAGQLIAYMGDSGNAEGTSPHLHFDIFVPGVVNPWGEERINPYPSLQAALAAGRIADGTAIAREPSTRLAGKSRVTTAIAVAANAFDSAETVVLASSRVPHDALVAGPLAAVHEAPVLLTDPNNLEPEPVAEIARLRAQRVIIVGEAGRLAAAVGQQLPGVTVEVVGSNERFATSVAVAEQVWMATGATGPDPDAPTEPDSEPAPPLELLDDQALADLANGNVPQLLLQLTGDRAGPTALLDGATVSSSDLRRGQLRSWLVGLAPAGVEQVEFVLDGHSVNTERQWPWDLGGTGGGWRDSGNGLDLPGPGEHDLEARVTKVDGSLQTVTAHFRVVPGSGDGDGDGDWREPELPARRAIVAKGQDPDAFRAWPDALAASWYGAARQMPVLLTSSDGLPDVIAAALNGVTEVLVAGGPGAVSQQQVATIEQLTSTTVRRLAGTDRYQTAAAVADDLLDRSMASLRTIHVATGANWPDAVTAGAAVAHLGGTLLLVDPAGNSPSVRDIISRLADDIDGVVALGGPNAVTTTALANVAAWAV